MSLRQQRVTSVVVCALALWGCSDDSSEPTVVPDAGDAALADAAPDSGEDDNTSNTTGNTTDATESNPNGTIDVVVSTDSTGDASVDAADGTEDASIDTDDDTNNTDDDTNDTSGSVDTTVSIDGDADVDATASSEGDADVDASNGESTSPTSTSSTGGTSNNGSTSSTSTGTSNASTNETTTSVDTDSGTTDSVSDAGVSSGPVSSDTTDPTVVLDSGTDSSTETTDPIPGEEGPVWDQVRWSGVLLGTGESVVTEEPAGTYCISTQDSGTFGFKYNVNQAASGADLGTYVPVEQMDRLMLDITGSDYTIHLVTQDGKEYCSDVTDGTPSIVFNSFYECGQDRIEEFHYHRYPIVSVLVVPQGGTFDFCVSTLDAESAEQG